MARDHPFNEEPTVATATTDVDDIRRRMAQIRRGLRENVQGVMAGAEAATDWRYYARRNPWLSLGLAFTIGFLIVPRRRRSLTETADAVAARVAQTVTPAPPPEPTKPRSSLLGGLVGLVSPVLIRIAQSYAASSLENLLTQQGLLGPLPSAGPRPGPSGGPGPRKESRP